MIMIPKKNVIMGSTVNPIETLQQVSFVSKYLKWNDLKPVWDIIDVYQK